MVVGKLLGAARHALVETIRSLQLLALHMWQQGAHKESQSIGDSC